MMPLQPSEKGFCWWELQSYRAAPGETTLPNRTGDALCMFITMIKNTHLVLLFRRTSLYLDSIHRPLASRTFFNGHQMLVPLADPVLWGPMNKQMSLAAGRGSPCPMSGGEGSCTVRSNASWVMITWGSSPSEQNDRRTPVRTLPSCNFVDGHNNKHSYRCQDTLLWHIYRSQMKFGAR